MRQLILALVLAVSSLAGEAPLAQPSIPPVIDKFDFLDATSVSSFVFFDSSENDFGAGVRFSYDINDHVELRGDYHTSGYKFDTDEFGSDVSLTLQFSYPIKDLPVPVEPYVITGTGIGSFDDPSIDAIIGVGFSVEVREKISVFFEYEFGSKESNSLLRLGASMTF